MCSVAREMMADRCFDGVGASAWSWRVQGCLKLPHRPSRSSAARIGVLRPVDAWEVVWTKSGGVAAHARDDPETCADSGEGSHDGCSSRSDHQIGRNVDGLPMAAWPARPPNGRFWRSALAQGARSRRGGAACARDDSEACADRGGGSHDGCSTRNDLQIGAIVDGHQMAACPARPPGRSTLAPAFGPNTSLSKIPPETVHKFAYKLIYKEFKTRRGTFGRTVVVPAAQL